MKSLFFIPIITLIIASPLFSGFIISKTESKKINTLRKCYIKENIRTTTTDSILIAQNNTASKTTSQNSIKQI